MVFGAVTLMAMALLHASLAHFPLDYACDTDRLPVLSCADSASSSSCPSRRECAPDEDPHAVALVVGWVVVAGLNAVSIVAIAAMYCLREGEACATFLGQKLVRTSAERREEEAEF